MIDTEVELKMTKTELEIAEMQKEDLKAEILSLRSEIAALKKVEEVTATEIACLKKALGAYVVFSRTAAQMAEDAVLQRFNLDLPSTFDEYEED